MLKRKIRISILAFSLIMTVAFSSSTFAAGKAQKALKAYKTFLQQQEEITGDLIKYFGIVYWNNDAVPELVTYRQGGMPSVYTFRNDKVVVTNSLARVYYTHYYKKKSTAIGVLFNKANDFKGTYSVNPVKQTIELLIAKEAGLYYQYTGVSDRRNEITKKEYDKLIKKQVGKTKATKIKYYKNTSKNRKKYLK